MACDGIFNCDVGDKSDELFCQLNLMKPEYLYALAAGVIIFALLIALVLYVKSKLKRKSYVRKLRTNKSSNNSVEETEPEIIESKYNPAKKFISMPIPNYIDFNALREADLKQDPSIDSIQQELDNKKAHTASTYELKKKDSNDEMMMSRLKLVRNSIELNNKNDFVSVRGNRNRKSIVRQISVPITKDTWLNQNPNNTANLTHQNSNPTNSSSLNSVKTEDSEDVTDNSNNAEKQKINKSIVYTKSRNKSNTSNTNSLRRNSYTKAIYYEDY